MAASSRVIHSRAGDKQIPDLLAMVFASELLRPSSDIWLVSPWISDIPILDNRADRFVTIDPAWSRRQVPLSQVLTRLRADGARVRVATRDIDTNRHFLETLSRVSTAAGSPIRVYCNDELHEKGLVTDRCFLSGSMNFTFNGITINQESVHLYTDHDAVARARTTMQSRWPDE
jgi:phosphatidylserine/phosphatidylglycerophosphate/cardiolipin synthase-like enzyme